MIAPNSAPQTIVVKVKRQDRPDSSPYWQTFDVPYRANLNITSLLQTIACNPRSTDGNIVAPPAYDAACLEEVCGSCTMVINGRVRQACSSLVDILLKENPGVITIEPMSKFPVLRDLCVDRSRMFENLRKVQGWIKIDGYYNAGPGPKIKQSEHDVLYPLSRCMTCGCCLEACPQFTIDNKFMGAQILSQVRYFNSHPTGKADADARMEAVMGEGGITDCGNAQNCVRVCPKEIPLVDSIAAIGRDATIYSIKKFFTK
jgi:succinate dehydrogenase / fumarate reductase iron-sulfur subunit